ncbi:MAG TPA: sigma-70 family RNA polymerase sigma factor [Stellaceae bacterium]|nr:sigma-70 family RNA polymerase sigma factor [Stellaceae bacterium]
MDISIPRPDGLSHLDHLMTRIADRQDRTAFAELFRLLAPKVKAYLVRWTGNPGLAEEIAQEAMLAVWRRAGTFDPARATMTTWVFTIARNRCIDHMREETRPLLDEHDPSLWPDTPETGDEAVEKIEQQHHLQLALSTLPPEQAELIRMAYYQGKAHGDIAVERSLPLGTVKSRLRSALARLRQTIDDGLRPQLPPAPAVRRRMPA